MGLEAEIGSLEVGKKADLVMINRDGLHGIPGNDIYAQIVYQLKAGDVALTMVDGRVVYEDGMLLTIDKDEVMRQAGVCLSRIKKKLPHLF